MRSRPHLRRSVSVKIKGKEQFGCYYLDHDSMTVHYGTKRTKPIPVGTLAPEACAQAALRDLINQD